MEVLQKYLKKRKNVPTKSGDQKGTVSSSKTKDEFFLPNSHKWGSKDPSNSIWDDGKHVETAAEKSASQTKPNSRFYMSGIVMCEGAKKLSPEEMALLEIDIFKPLDFYEILFKRTKESSNGRIISNLNEL